MRIPRTLARVPEDDDVRRLLRRCPQTFEGRRNRALMAFLADSGLRISEALRLLAQGSWLDSETGFLSILDREPQFPVKVD